MPNANRPAKIHARIVDHVEDQVGDAWLRAVHEDGVEKGLSGFKSLAADLDGVSIRQLSSTSKENKLLNEENSRAGENMHLG